MLPRMTLAQWATHPANLVALSKPSLRRASSIFSTCTVVLAPVIALLMETG